MATTRSEKSSPEQAPTPPAIMPGPPPTDPNPAPPTITPEQLALLTEASATKGGMFQCTLCSKQFGYKNGLIRHVRLTHVGEKPYQCNICNRRFGYKHILMEHQNLHFGNRPYACNMCDKRFAARSNLIQHRMVHKRPFNCNMCNKRFDREDQLKKHLFAHPQSLLTCNVCKYTATNQTDLNKHMFETHHPDGRRSAGPEGEQVRPGEEGNVPHQPGEAAANGQTTPQPPGLHAGNNGDISRAHSGEQPVSPPDSSEDCRGGGADGAPRGEGGRGGGGQGRRIHAICNQLSTSVASVPPGLHPQQGPYHGVIIKKEAVDEADVCMEEQQQQQQRQGPCPSASPSHHPRGPPPPGLGGEGVVPMSEYQPPLSFPQEMLRSAPHLGPIYANPPISGSNMISSMAHDLLGKVTEDKGGLAQPPPPGLPPNQSPQQHSALPAIHEVFSRRPQKLPPFANFGIPMLSPENRLTMNLPHPELTLSMMSPPPPTGFSAPVSSGGHGHGPGAAVMNQAGQRPTAQLPPITQVLKGGQSKDQGVQHSAPIPGFPTLDEVLSYYMSQGKLFKCQHCNILFFERGMFFLHASLHGQSSPWECSICHKVCSDKNEFTLHFVNQQHHSQ